MKEQNDIENNQQSIIKNLTELLAKENFHVSLDASLASISFSLLGGRPSGLPYSIWQLAEHIRIAQWDILEFCRNEKHTSPKWPDEYWPEAAAPESEADWKDYISNIQEDSKAFIELIKNAKDDLYKPFTHGNGQTLLKEALVLADHNAYHVAEIIVIRRLLNAWGK